MVAIVLKAVKSLAPPEVYANQVEGPHAVWTGQFSLEHRGNVPSLGDPQPLEPSWLCKLLGKERGRTLSNACKI